jgi:hypothetical protein
LLQERVPLSVSVSWSCPDAGLDGGAASSGCDSRPDGSGMSRLKRC